MFVVCLMNLLTLVKYQSLKNSLPPLEVGKYLLALILQVQIQLKAIYKDNMDTIIGNCDTTLFLGGKEKSTLKEISEMLGKETIDLYNQSDSRGSQRSSSTSYQKLGKALMSQDEIAVMNGGKCILQMRGVRPFLSEKYDITKHKNYKYLSDYNPKNKFDIEKYLKKKWVVKEDTKIDMHYDLGKI